MEAGLVRGGGTVVDGALDPGIFDVEEEVDEDCPGTEDPAFAGVEELTALEDVPDELLTLEVELLELLPLPLFSGSVGPWW